MQSTSIISSLIEEHLNMAICKKFSKGWMDFDLICGFELYTF